MGLSEIYDGMSRAASGAKEFLGNALQTGMKFAQGIDNYAGMARGVIGAVAPIAGSLTGPVGAAVGAGISGGMWALGAYDRLKSEAMHQGSQMAGVATAAKRGMG